VPHLYFGLDLGQRAHPAALVLVERLSEPLGRIDPVTYERQFSTSFYVRHAERLALGTPYLQVVRRVRALAANCPASGPGAASRTLVMDASGVGAPLVELFRTSELNATLVPVTITSGGEARSDQLTGGYLVPRRDLISALRLMFESGLLKIPVGMNSREHLIEELAGLSDHPTGRRDDLALALSLAVWRARRQWRFADQRT